MQRTRRAPRAPTRRVFYRSASGLAADCAEVLGAGRLFVNTRRPLAPGARCRVVLALDGTEVRLRLEGLVAHVAPLGNALNETPGMLLAIERPPVRMLRELSRWALAHRRPGTSGERLAGMA